MHTKTIAELIVDLRDKKISSRELTQCYLDRIKAHDPKINSFITVLEAEALAAADHAERRPARISESA